MVVTPLCSFEVTVSTISPLSSGLADNQLMVSTSGTVDPLSQPRTAVRVPLPSDWVVTLINDGARGSVQQRNDNHTSPLGSELMRTLF